MDDAALSRRELLERAAYAAGMAGAASLLPADTLLQAAARAKASPMPKPRDMQIDHFVVVMMENRSFDHYFGWLGQTGYVDGSQSETYLGADGTTTYSTRHASSMGQAEWQGCGFSDPGHGWGSGRVQLEKGFMAQGSGNDEFALTYYNQGELGFIHDAAQAYTIHDRWFCSQLGPTWPNRYYKWSGQSGGKNSNAVPANTLGNQWETIFDVALRNNPANAPLPGALTARYYNSDLPFSATFGPRGIPWTRPLAEYYADCAAGTLPNIAFVDPPFRDGGGFDGNSADEHPHGDVRLGQAWMADVVRAFTESPNYRRGALFIIYDEWGGFFDHVRPPSVPDNRQDLSDLNKDFGQMGFRIPAVTVSPWTRNRSRSGDEYRVDHGVYGTESILKLIMHRFALDWDRTRDDAAPLRVDASNNVGESFNWNKPDFDPPDLPDPQHIVSKPCEMGGGDVLADESAQAHESDLAELEGLADRFGFAVGDSKPADLFRSPDGVRKSLAASG